MNKPIRHSAGCWGSAVNVDDLLRRPDWTAPPLTPVDGRMTEA